MESHLLGNWSAGLGSGPCMWPARPPPRPPAHTCTSTHEAGPVLQSVAGLSECGDGKCSRKWVAKDIAKKRTVAERSLGRGRTFPSW